MQLKLKKLNVRLQFGLLLSCCKRRFEQNYSAICFDVLFVWFSGQKRMYSNLFLSFVQTFFWEFVVNEIISMYK